MPRLLLIEDDVTFSGMLAKFLERHGYQVICCSHAREALKRIEDNGFDLVFTDLRLPDEDGISVLSKLKKLKPELPVILMTGYAQVSTAVEAMKKGAFDYISKPFNQEEVLEVLKNALKHPQPATSASEKPQPQEAFPEERPSLKVKGISQASKKLNEYIDLVAPTSMSVLIMGESGTGKEVVAQRIHQWSERSKKPFIPVDCGAIPREIAGSEFFGHLKGSFTGAVQDKRGHFEEANGGTLFLDEVGNLPYEVQVQLLRALQERKIKPIGSSKEIEVDIRVISATNEDLAKAVTEGRFREDLFHRLNEFSIRVPSLAARKDDLMIFAEHFLQLANTQLNKQVLGFSDQVLREFQQYHWPGNLRELQNLVKKSVLLCQGTTITASDLPSEFMEALENSTTTATPVLSKKAHEKDLILKALEEAENNKTQAARLLQITRKTLYNKLKEYSIDA